MEKVKQIAEKHSDKLKYLLLIGAFIGLMNESQAREKTTLFYILLYSVVIDITWCFFWSSKWSLIKEDIESGTHGLVLSLSWIGILIKAVVLLVIIVSERHVLKGSLPKAIKEKLNSEYLPQMDDNFE